MLMPPQTLGFNYLTGSDIGNRPGTGVGVNLAVGTSNSYGAYSEVVSDADITRDCYRMIINVQGVAVSNTQKSALVTIGADTSGGTSYAALVPDLIVGSACSWGVSGAGHWYDFPIYVPAGTALAAKAQTSHTVGGNCRVAIWLYGAPTCPENLVYGQGVEAIGVAAASSAGTSVTAGTTSDGAWTSLGTTARKWIATQCAFELSSDTMGGVTWTADTSYGDGTNQVPLIYDALYNSTGSEQISRLNPYPALCCVPAGSTIYGRLQCSGTPTAGPTMAAYGVY